MRPNVNAVDSFIIKMADGGTLSYVVMCEGCECSCMRTCIYLVVRVMKSGAEIVNRCNY